MPPETAQQWKAAQEWMNPRLSRISLWDPPGLVRGGGDRRTREEGRDTRRKVLGVGDELSAVFDCQMSMIDHSISDFLIPISIRGIFNRKRP